MKLQEDRTAIQGKQIEWIPSQKEFEGIPICSQYKYLGIQPLVNRIKKKIGHTTTKVSIFKSNICRRQKRHVDNHDQTSFRSFIPNPWKR